MKDEQIKDNGLNRRILALGYYQLIGGLSGFILTFWGTFQLELGNQGWLKIGLYLTLLIPFYFSIHTGAQCLKSNGNCLKLSRYNQILQLINFSILGYTYKFLAGFYFGIGLDLTTEPNLKIDFETPTAQLEINSDGNNLIVMLNLVALFLLNYIMKLENQLDIPEDI